jgi:hypothetical protein
VTWWILHIRTWSSAAYIPSFRKLTTKLNWIILTLITVSIKYVHLCLTGCFFFSKQGYARIKTCMVQAVIVFRWKLVIVCTVGYYFNCPKRTDVIQTRNDVCAKTSLITLVLCSDWRTEWLHQWKFCRLNLRPCGWTCHVITPVSFYMIKNLRNARKYASVSNLSCSFKGDLCNAKEICDLGLWRQWMPRLVTWDTWHHAVW